MSKGVKIAIGVVAAVAIPFVAPIIGGAIAASTGISTVLASTAAGAALGGAAGYATGGGRGALIGGALGGLGGFYGSGGFGETFGGTAAGTTAGAGGGVLPSLAAGQVGQVGLSAVPATGLPALGGVSAAAAATPSVLGGLTNSLIQGAPNALAQLSILAFNKPPEELDEAQRRLLAQMQEEAKTNRDLFIRKFETAQNLIRQGQNPDFAGAYANAVVPVQRALREEERKLIAQGGSPEQAAALRRAGIIETAGRAPRATAVAGEEGRRTLAAGAALMPTQAPVDRTAATEVAIAERKKAEQDKQAEQMSRIAGGLFGGPSYTQNRYGGVGQPTIPSSTQPAAQQRTAGLSETPYSSIYEQPEWASQAFGA